MSQVKARRKRKSISLRLYWDQFPIQLTPEAKCFDTNCKRLSVPMETSQKTMLVNSFCAHFHQTITPESHIQGLPFHLITRPVWLLCLRLMQLTSIQVRPEFADGDQMRQIRISQEDRLRLRHLKSSKFQLKSRKKVLEKQHKLEIQVMFEKKSHC